MVKSAKKTTPVTEIQYGKLFSFWGRSLSGKVGLARYSTTKRIIANVLGLNGRSYFTISLSRNIFNIWNFQDFTIIFHHYISMIIWNLKHIIITKPPSWPQLNTSFWRFPFYFVSPPNVLGEVFKSDSILSTKYTDVSLQTYDQRLHPRSLTANTFWKKR